MGKNKKINSMEHSECGAIAVEAITTLMIFILFFYILLSIMNVIRTQAIVQSAACETAKEISAYSYLLVRLGYFDDKDKADEDAADTNKIIDNMGSLIEATNSGEAVDTDKITETVDLLKGTDMHDLTATIASAGLSQGSNAAFCGIISQMAPKYLPDNGDPEYLKKLGIKDGKLNYNNSVYSQGKGQPITVVITYEIDYAEVPLLDIDFKSNIVVSATTRIWGN